MNSYSYITLLISLSFISAITLLSVLFLDFINIRPTQKIAIMKIGIIMIVLAPLIFFLIKQFSWQILDIKLFDGLIGKEYSNTNNFISKETSTDWSLYLLGTYVVGLFFMLSQLFIGIKARKKT